MGASLIIAGATLVVSAVSASKAYDEGKAQASRQRRAVRRRKSREAVSLLRQKRLARARVAAQAAASGVSGSITTGAIQAIESSAQTASRQAGEDLRTDISNINAASQARGEQIGISLVGDVLNTSAAAYSTDQMEQKNELLAEQNQLLQQQIDGV